MSKHILIIDDDVRVLRYLQQGLMGLGDGYAITAVNSPEEALTHIEGHKPDLVISDLRMPGIDGLQLLQQIHERYNDTRLVLMTAYGTDEVQEAARKLGIYRFITKPFRNENLINIARSALSDADNIAISTEGMLIIPDKSLTAINDVLHQLRTEVRPELALMADMSGHVITHVGTTMGIDLNSLVALVAGSFATAAELDRIFEKINPYEQQAIPDDEPMYVTYQEGRNHDCYSANVGRDLFFTVVFKRQGANKVGMVWLYMRRTFRNLQEIIMTQAAQVPPELISNNSTSVVSEFETMFKDEIDKKIE
ncbi:MAG: response regulator [Chloroflexi bacterium]|nr:response regulator [Chloroflexota bacterium]